MTLAGFLWRTIFKYRTECVHFWPDFVACCGFISIAVNELHSWCRGQFWPFRLSRVSIKILHLHPNIFNKMGTSSTINLHWLPIYWSQYSIYVLRTNKLLLMFINVNTANTHTQPHSAYNNWVMAFEKHGRGKRLLNVRAPSFRFHSLRESGTSSAYHLHHPWVGCAWGRLPALNIHYNLVRSQIRKLFIHAINVTILVCYAHFSFRTILYGRNFYPMSFDK